MPKFRVIRTRVLNFRASYGYHHGSSASPHASSSYAANIDRSVTFLQVIAFASPERPLLTPSVLLTLRVGYPHACSDQSLFATEVSVSVAASEEFGVGAAIHNATPGEDHDLLAVHDGAQAVRDD